MSGKPDSRLGYANVMATVALFVALGGTAIAAKNALDGQDIQKRSIPGNRLVQNSVGSNEVKGLVAKDFKPGRLPAGPRGTTGPQGATGPSGLTGLQQVVNSSAVNTATPKNVTATCPPGKRAIGGGATHSNASPGLIVIDQIQPSDEDTVPGVVTVSAYETGSVTSWSVTAFAVCANLP